VSVQKHLLPHPLVHEGQALCKETGRETNHFIFGALEEELLGILSKAKAGRSSIQVKRIHEYKRQFRNTFHMYMEIKSSVRTPAETQSTSSSVGAPCTGRSLVAVGDALGMLHGAAKFKSKDPGINLLFMELALIFAPSGASIETLHIWSEENSLADALSRLDEGAALPLMLTKVPRTRARDEGWHIVGRTAAPLRRPRRAGALVV